jgi:DNA-binding response OmpR family regulator/curved DNA-binding protein CbpA
MSSARVLVVEDNPRIGEKLQEVLSRSGFAATLARDGAAALDLFSRARFDLVVVEHLVPGVEGGRFVDRLRALDDEVPVVVMAAAARAQTRLTQQGPGFIQGFLLKPFRVPDLLQAVSAALAGRGSEAAPAGSTSPAPVLQGVVDEGTLAELVVHLLRRAAVGVLRFEKDGARRDVYFVNGLPVFAESNLLTETFGRWLLSRGVLSPEEYAALRAYCAEHHVRQGEGLVAQGVMSHQQVYALLRGQVIERVARCMAWLGSSYVFVEDARFLEEKLSFPMNPLALLVEGALRRSPSEALEARAAAWAGDTLTPTAVLDELGPFLDRLHTGASLTAALKAARTVGDVATSLALPPTRLAALIEVLSACGAVQRGDAELPEVATLPGAPEAEFVLESLEQLDPSPEAAPDTLGEEVIARYLATRGGDHYAVLGVARDATPHAVEAAWLDLSSKFHPDRFVDHEDADIRLRAKEVFIKGAQAFAVLADPHAAKRYQERLEENKTQPTARFAAEEELARGEACLVRGEHLAARLAFARAHAADPQEPLYQALLGWATWLDATHDEDREEGQELIEAALAQDARLTLGWELLARVHDAAGRAQHADDSRARAASLRSGLLARRPGVEAI